MMYCLPFLICLILHFDASLQTTEGEDNVALPATWSEWWSHNGISGPQFWGLVNSEWILCSTGRRQSPIDINPRQLLYDPQLKKIHVNDAKINGVLKNTGNMLRFVIEEGNSEKGEKEEGEGGVEEESRVAKRMTIVNITGGSLSYDFKAHEILFHFGGQSSMGSEHTIDGTSFPAEIQILGYNTDLYQNVTQAKASPHGLVALGILCKVCKQSNKGFQRLSEYLGRVKLRGEKREIQDFCIKDLLPETTEYITYEGSMTVPGCEETVTWLIYNKPMCISQNDLLSLRELMHGDQEDIIIGLENNFRPPEAVNNRPIRTNINFHPKTADCTMDNKFNYQTLFRKTVEEDKK